MPSLFDRLWGFVRPGWRYKGITNRMLHKHEWTDGTETITIYYMRGAGSHAGFCVEVSGDDRDHTLKLENGFVVSVRRAMILADLYAREDMADPAAFMSSDRVSSEHSPGSSVRQDEWLAAHAPDYEFAVIDPDALEK